MVVMRGVVQLKMRKTPADLLGAHPCLAWGASRGASSITSEQHNHKSQPQIAAVQYILERVRHPHLGTRTLATQPTMSYTFSILSPLDVPLFTHDFGTSRSGGDGIARFTPAERALVPFILHSALDIVEEVQWGPSTSSGSAPMYLKHIDKYQNCYISCWITGANTRFLLLTRPRDESLGLTGSGGGARGTSRGERMEKV